MTRYKTQKGETSSRVARILILVNKWSMNPNMTYPLRRANLSTSLVSSRRILVCKLFESQESREHTHGGVSGAPVILTCTSVGATKTRKVIR